MDVWEVRMYQKNEEVYFFGASFYESREIPYMKETYMKEINGF